MVQTPKNEQAPMLASRSPESVNIGELIAVIACRWKRVLAFVVIGLIIALAIWAVMPAKWQGDMVVQIGRVSERRAGESPLIESPEQFAARVTSRNFLDQVFLAAGYGGGAGDTRKPEAMLLLRSIKANAIRNADFVQISFLAYSREDLAKFSKLIAQQVVAAHDETFSPVKVRLQTQLQDINNKIDAAEKARSAIQSDSRIGKGTAESTSGLLAVGLMQANAVLMESLMRSRSDLEKFMSPAVLYPTTVSSLVIDDTPNSPKLGLAVALGILGGFVVGAIAALMSRPR
ncbi:hypothetical protein FEE59_08045 [Herbaspirillum sp. RU 5E]|uniref:hypothetical protein n=1 Tax=Herbaspirillum sp. CAH-3 TaxID=2605746 RepID=UPI0012AC7031|nr:hypothetical protein [Herbaspirillum sp. CAH-3]MBW9333454.1 hypothetical protein [Herbaspirillum sp. RU 5E]MRT28547.1 hypothetical protein [Herbaspirillum sp. CAH-3]